MSQISQNARTEKNVLYKYLALEQPKDKVTLRCRHVWEHVYAIDWLQNNIITIVDLTYL